MSTSVMAQRQQDKLLERIKVLRKLKENRKCFECLSKSPPCVDTTHNTFVCLTCSGILRIFNFRVKTISISSFNLAEVEGLEAGGNKAARKQWLSGFTGDYPASGNADQVKEFVRKKYEEKAWIKSSSSGRKKSKQSALESDDDVADEDDDISRIDTKKAKRKERKSSKSSLDQNVFSKPAVPDLLDLNDIFSQHVTVSSSIPAASVSQNDWGFSSVPVMQKQSLPTDWNTQFSSPQFQQQSSGVQQQNSIPSSMPPSLGQATSNDPFAGLLSGSTGSSSAGLVAEHNPFSSGPTTAPSADDNPFGAPSLFGPAASQTPAQHQAPPQQQTFHQPIPYSLDFGSPQPNQLQPQQTTAQQYGNFGGSSSGYNGTTSVPFATTLVPASPQPSFQQQQAYGQLYQQQLPAPQQQLVGSLHYMMQPTQSAQPNFFSKVSDTVFVSPQQKAAAMDNPFL